MSRVMMMFVHPTEAVRHHAQRHSNEPENGTGPKSEARLGGA
jgi:hypothetical protein